jgi:hypothetical protein
MASPSMKAGESVLKVYSNRHEHDPVCEQESKCIKDAKQTIIIG